MNLERNTEMAILLGRYPRILHVLTMMSTIYQKFYDKTME
jgi:hypothetical protein